MHELSIAVSLIELAEEEASRIDGRICAVHLKLGAMSGVVKDALLFAYDVACRDTSLEGSHLVIEDVPAVVYCPVCDGNRALESVQLFVCPECGTPTPMVVEGKEIQMVALEVE